MKRKDPLTDDELEALREPLISQVTALLQSMPACDVCRVAAAVYRHASNGPSPAPATAVPANAGETDEPSEPVEPAGGIEVRPPREEKAPSGDADPKPDFSGLRGREAAITIGAEK